MRYLAVAVDYDGTLASEGRVKDSTTRSLEALKASGRRALLVTGRQVGDLRRVYPKLAVFDLIVAENGAVLYDPSTDGLELLARPFPGAFAQALRDREVQPLELGDIVVASLVTEERKIRSAIEELALDAQIITNRESAMVLPRGVDKASGTAAALERLGVGFSRVVAIGDSENDEILFRACGAGIAVSNAIEPLRAMADHVTTGIAGEGVEELLEELLRNDLARLAA